MLNEINTVLAEADLLVNEQQIAAAIAKIAEQINSLLADCNPLVLCVMNGGLVFTGQLLPQLSIALNLDSINASRYHNQTSGGTIEWVNTPRTPIKGRTAQLSISLMDGAVAFSLTSRPTTRRFSATL